MQRLAAASLLTLLAACSPKSAELRSFVSGQDGFDTASYWLDTGKEVVVFDAQFTPAIAEQLLADIRAVTDRPIRYVVATHPNPDKFGGASVFQREGAVFVASEATSEAMPGVHEYKRAYFEGVGMFAPGTYPERPSVDLTFDRELTLDLDGRAEVKLVVLDHPGVTSTQTVAIVDGVDVIVGDLVAGQAHAWLEGAIVGGQAVPDIAGWTSALSELQTLVGDAAIVHPGRGTPGKASTILPEQRAYLEALDQIVSAYVDTLDDPVNALSTDSQTHWEAITAEAVEAYPDYALPYLVTYGVYGLAFQRASE